MTDQLNRALLGPLSDQSILGAAYRTLDLRNRWAHPRTHEPMEPIEALRGVDAMIVLVTALGGTTEDLRTLRDAIGASTGESTLPDDPAESSLGEGAWEIEDTSGIDEDEITSRMTLRPGTGPAYEAAIHVRAQAFESTGSVFDAPRPTWTVENLGKLERRLLDENEGGLDQFLGRYVGQLADARAEVVQLAGEVLYVHLWINGKSISGPTKRAAIERVLSTRSGCVQMPPRIADALDMGLVQTGAWFHQNRWHYLRAIVDTALAIHRMPATEGSALLDEPWRFREWLMRCSDGLAQRHALLHLLFPDTFEAIVSASDKVRILQHLGSQLSSRTTNYDQDLFVLRRVLAPEYGPRYDYYRPPVVGRWRRV